MTNCFGVTYICHIKPPVVNRCLYIDLRIRNIVREDDGGNWYLLLLRRFKIVLTLV